MCFTTPPFQKEYSMSDQKNGQPWLAVAIITAIVAVMMAVLWAEPASAQTLEGAAHPSSVLFGDASACLTAAVASLPPKEAAKFCLEARRLEARRAEAAAKAAAKAAEARAKAANPCGGWFPSSWCYGTYGGGYFFSGERFPASRGHGGHGDGGTNYVYRR